MTTDSDTRWRERIEALDTYVDREGDALVPANHVEGTINLGSWVSYLRTRYRQGQLNDGRVSELEDYPGWEWGPLRPGPKSDVARDTQIKKMRAEGKSLREIGQVFGLSRQRVHQIVNNNA